MERFSQFHKRVGPQVRALVTGPRVAGVVLGLGLVAALLWAVRRPGTETHVSLWPGQTLAAEDIARMTTAFRKAGLPQVQVTGRQIQVPARHRQAYLTALEAARVPLVDFDDALQTAVVDSNPFASHRQLEQNYKYANQKKLARIVAGMQGIEAASVQYDEVKQPGFPPTVEKRAIVAVRGVGQRPLEYEEIEAIRDTVTGYVGGLDRSRVTVTDLGAGRAYPGTTARHPALLPGALFSAAQATLEKEYRQKIRDRLTMYPGVVVGVNVHFGPAGPTAADAGAPVPALVTASIDVPRSVFQRIWRERNSHPSAAARAPEQLPAVEADVRHNISRAVAALLPPPADDWKTLPQVTVTTYDDVLAPPVATQPPRLAVAVLHGRTWPVLGAALAAVTLICFLSRRIGARRTRNEADSAHLAPRPAAEFDGLLETRTAGLPAATPAVHRDLQQVVQRDPGTAGQLLNQWIGEAA
jgi:flagellar biosynthesis/type III secretory pathway M-ring protein FliF/YscJ